MNAARAYYNEIDPYCCKVLAKQIKLGNLPEGDIDDRDIRDVSARDVAGYAQVHLFAGIGGIPYGLRLAGMPDELSIITGGFPCQDLSYAGKGAGLAGARSGLWSEYARLIRDLRPAYALVENVPALLGRGLGTVLGDLAACGYDAEWDCIPACAVGAPHRRDRVWLVAYAGCKCDERRRVFGELDGPAGAGQGAKEERQRIRDAAVNRGAPVADANGQRCEEQHVSTLAGAARQPGWRAATGDVANAQRHSDRSQVFSRETVGAYAGRSTGGAGRSRWREAEPAVCRVDDGVPARLDRLRGLGNAVVPYVVRAVAAGILAHAGVAPVEALGRAA